MKLKDILIENKMIIRDAGEALGDLIQFVQESGQKETINALNDFLKAPNPQKWKDVKWIIDSMVNLAMTSKTDDLKPRMQKWLSLNQITSPLISAAVYDIDKKDTKGTPLQGTALSKSVRDKVKSALGPQGYISMLANTDSIPASKLKKTMKNTAKDSAALVKASKKAYPGIKQVNKF